MGTSASRGNSLELNSVVYTSEVNCVAGNVLESLAGPLEILVQGDMRAAQAQELLSNGLSRSLIKHKLSLRAKKRAQ